MTEPDHDDHGGPSTRTIRIAAIGVGAVLIVGLAVAVGTAGGSSPKPDHTAPAAVPTGTPTPSTSAPSVAPPAPTMPQPSATPTATAVTVRWHGTVTTDGPDAHRDLDAIPPRENEQEADLTGSTFEAILQADSSGVQLAMVTGKSDFRHCRDAAFGNGTDHTPTLTAGDVVCVLTSQQRVARLRVLRASLSFPAATVKADVTVWDPPQGSG